jgi:ParB-like chromosome segregation protein Spo0J
MTTSEVTLIPLRHLRVLPNNPRTVTQAKLNQLCDSIRENGFYAHRALAVEPIPGTPDYYVLDGNQRKKALARLKQVVHVGEYMNRGRREGKGKRV